MKKPKCYDLVLYHIKEALEKSSAAIIIPTGSELIRASVEDSWTFTMEGYKVTFKVKEKSKV